MPRTTLVVLHGHGDHPAALTTRVRDLPAVRAHGVEVLAEASPHGPDDAPAWFGHDRHGAPHRDELHASLAHLDAAVGALAAAGPVVVVGYSQGAALALTWALWPGRVSALPAALAVLAGFLPPGDLDLDPARAAGLALLALHGEDDEIVPLPLGRSVARLAERNGADVRFVETPGGHEVSDAMLRELDTWLDPRLDTWLDPSLDPRLDPRLDPSLDPPN